MFKLNPVTLKKIERFKSIRRGYVSFILFTITLIMCVFGELLINNRALVVSYEGNMYFPTYGAQFSGKDFGLDYSYEVNYRELQKKFDEEGNDNWMIMPIIPYNPVENDMADGVYPPTAPDASRKHYMGTDSTGRDIIARIFYGYRIAIAFSLILLIVNYTIGVSIGSAMGFFGGRFDLFFQRVIEIWSNIPFLYVIMIVASIVTPSFLSLILIMAGFGWMGMTWQMRTTTYKEKAREYISAARSLGASNHRLVFKHIIPNSISIIITFVPFSIVGGITSLTALDYLGFGLMPPTPSWGNLLDQGLAHLDSWWILTSVISAMVLVLVMITFIGEAIREAFDPKKHTTYE